MHETHGWSRRLGWCVVLLTILMLSPGYAPAAEPQKFTLINVDLDGTKIWLPSSIMVHQGDDVELTLINKLEDPHGFAIKAFGIEQVVQPKSQVTVAQEPLRTAAALPIQVATVTFNTAVSLHDPSWVRRGSLIMRLTCFSAV